MTVRYVAPKEYADIYGVGIRTVYRLIKSGALRAERIGWQWRIPLDNQVHLRPRAPHLLKRARDTVSCR